MNFLRRGILFVCCLSVCSGAYADALQDALRATYTACMGIDDSLSDMKKMAGINTAVTGVGTAAGVGATVVGIVKASKDSRIAQLEKELEKLHEIEQRRSFEVPNREQLLGTVDAYYEENKNPSREIEDEIQKLTDQSKSLGNWRTGLLAGNTATNVAGAIIAGNNRVDDDLQKQIDGCRAAVENLGNAMQRGRVEGAAESDMLDADKIVTACSEYNNVDTKPINNRAKGAMISSIVGAATGVAGTVTSAVANTDATRNDNTDAGKQKEKNLNTAANILAGASTAASATATVFNATQISAIKKVVDVAQKCEGALR